jgi:hypothetical protein
VKRLTLLLAFPLAAAATSWGDFSATLSTRLPYDWYPPTEAEANKTAAEGWTAYDVTCEENAGDCSPVAGTVVFPEAWGCDEAVPDDATSDVAEINCLITNSAEESVLYFEAGTYNLDTGEHINITHDELVLRGAGVTSIISINKQGDHGGGGKACDAESVVLVYPAADGDTNFTNWTAGYTAGTTVITVASAANISAGDYILLEADEAGGKMDNPDPGLEGEAWTYTVKVSSVDGNNVTIDRPLRLDFNTSNQKVYTDGVTQPWIESIGLENVKFVATNRGGCGGNDSACWGPYICMKWAKESWVTDVYFDEPYDQSIRMDRGCARNWIEATTSNGQTDTSQGGNYHIWLTSGSSDNVVENNVFYDSDMAMVVQSGAQGNVLAYNYCNDVGDQGNRCVFLHGTYGHHTLAEGNHHYGGRVEIDDHWGRSGPGNVIYRARMNMPPTCWKWDGGWENEAVSCEVDGDCGSGYTCEESDNGGITTEIQNNRPPHEGATVLGSIITGMFSRPSGDGPPDYQAYFDTDGPADDDVWVERTIVRGCDAGNCEETARSSLNLEPGANTTTVTNLEAANSDGGAWSGFTGPDSLYRSSAPSWWCQEACDWDLLTGIGAFGDDITPGSEASLCKLPSKIIDEAGTCTAMDASSTATISGGSLLGGSIQ